MISGMTSEPIPAFKKGDEVVLVEGTYPGTRGVFLNFRPDPNWADIEELSGRIRSHPIAWLDHWTGSYVRTPVRGNHARSDEKSD